MTLRIAQGLACSANAEFFRYPGNMSTPHPVQSVDRAVTVLKLLADDEGLTVSAIAEKLGVHVSTASRLISGLRAHDLIERSELNGGLRLGVGLLRLAGVVVSRLDIATHSQPVCDALAAQAGETANVAILDGDAGINVSQAGGPGTVAMQNWVGQRMMLHPTSSGKVLLAYLPADRRRELLAGTLTSMTPATHADAGALELELAEVRTRGWAQAVEELEEGLNAVAAPIRDHTGRVVAALSAAGPAYRLTLERLPEVAQMVIRSAREISRQLGAPAP